MYRFGQNVSLYKNFSLAQNGPCF